MPAVVKEHVDSKQTSPTRSNGVGSAIILLGIALVLALIASFVPPSSSTIQATDIPVLVP
jgi:hypothetical protein